MSDVINGVPCELLERLADIAEIEGQPEGAQARALLTAQSQASEIGLIDKFAAEYPEEWDHAVKHTEAQDKLYAAREALVAVGDESRCLELLDSAIFAFENLPADGEQPSAAQSAPAEPKPTGLSRGWNLVRQCDGFVIGHSSIEPNERHKRQALADGRVYVPFMVEQSAQPVAQDQGKVQRLREVLTRLLSYAERQICTHEETHRGGAIWEICDICGDMWADDKGGKPEFKWPAEIEAARAIFADIGSEELELCPFCGFHPSASADDCIYPVTADRKVWSLNCYETGGGCGAAVLGGSPEECIALWNTRTSRG